MEATNHKCEKDEGVAEKKANPANPPRVKKVIREIKTIDINELKKRGLLSDILKKKPQPIALAAGSVSSAASSSTAAGAVQLPTTSASALPMSSGALCENDKNNLQITSPAAQAIEQTINVKAKLKNIILRKCAMKAAANACAILTQQNSQKTADELSANSDTNSTISSKVCAQQPSNSATEIPVTLVVNSTTRTDELLHTGMEYIPKASIRKTNTISAERNVLLQVIAQKSKSPLKCLLQKKNVSVSEECTSPKETASLNILENRILTQEEMIDIKNLRMTPSKVLSVSADKTSEHPPGDTPISPCVLVNPTNTSNASDESSLQPNPLPVQNHSEEFSINVSTPGVQKGGVKKIIYRADKLKSLTQSRKGDLAKKIIQNSERHITHCATTSAPISQSQSHVLSLPASVNDVLSQSNSTSAQSKPKLLIIPASESNANKDNPFDIKSISTTVNNAFVIKTITQKQVLPIARDSNARKITLSIKTCKGVKLGDELVSPTKIKTILANKAAKPHLEITSPNTSVEIGNIITIMPPSTSVIDGNVINSSSSRPDQTEHTHSARSISNSSVHNIEVQSSDLDLPTTLTTTSTDDELTNCVPLNDVTMQISNEITKQSKETILKDELSTPDERYDSKSKLVVKDNITVQVGEQLESRYSTDMLTFSIKSTILEHAHIDQPHIPIAPKESAIDDGIITAAVALNSTNDNEAMEGITKENCKDANLAETSNNTIRRKRFGVNLVARRRPTTTTKQSTQILNNSKAEDNNLATEQLKTTINEKLETTIQQSQQVTDRVSQSSEYSPSTQLVHQSNEELTPKSKSQLIDAEVTSRLVEMPKEAQSACEKTSIESKTGELSNKSSFVEQPIQPARVSTCKNDKTPDDAVVDNAADTPTKQQNSTFCDSKSTTAEINLELNRISKDEQQIADNASGEQVSSEVKETNAVTKESSDHLKATPDKKKELKQMAITRFFVPVNKVKTNLSVQPSKGTNVTESCKQLDLKSPKQYLDNQSSINSCKKGSVEDAQEVRDNKLNEEFVGFNETSSCHNVNIRLERLRKASTSVKDCISATSDYMPDANYEVTDSNNEVLGPESNAPEENIKISRDSSRNIPPKKRWESRLSQCEDIAVSDDNSPDSDYDNELPLHDDDSDDKIVDVAAKVIPLENACASDEQNVSTTNGSQQELSKSMAIETPNKSSKRRHHADFVGNDAMPNPSLVECSDVPDAKRQRTSTNTSDPFETETVKEVDNVNEGKQHKLVECPLPVVNSPQLAEKRKRKSELRKSKSRAGSDSENDSKAVTFARKQDEIFKSPTQGQNVGQIVEPKKKNRKKNVRNDVDHCTEQTPHKDKDHNIPSPNASTTMTIADDSVPVEYKKKATKLNKSESEEKSLTAVDVTEQDNVTINDTTSSIANAKDSVTVESKKRGRKSSKFENKDASSLAADATKRENDTLHNTTSLPSDNTSMEISNVSMSVGSKKRRSKWRKPEHEEASLPTVDVVKRKSVALNTSSSSLPENITRNSKSNKEQVIISENANATPTLQNNKRGRKSKYKTIAVSGSEVDEVTESTNAPDRNLQCNTATSEFDKNVKNIKTENSRLLKYPIDYKNKSATSSSFVQTTSVAQSINNEGRNAKEQEHLNEDHGDSKNENTTPPSHTVNSDVTVQKKRRGRKPKNAAANDQQNIKQEHISTNSNVTVNVTESMDVPFSPLKKIRGGGRKSQINKTIDQNEVLSYILNDDVDDPLTTETIPTADLFNPLLLIITNRDQLNSNEPLNASESTAIVGEVQCGLCLVCVTNDKWKSHLDDHYGVAWIYGQPAINVKSRSVVLYTMVNYFKAKKKTMNCRMCHKVFRSAIGLLGHLECCGAEPVRIRRGGRKSQINKTIDQNEVLSYILNDDVDDPLTSETIPTADLFNPLLLIITNRDQLNSNEPLNASESTAIVGEVQCGLCLVCVTNDKWKSHLDDHYGVAWIYGQPAINVKSRSVVLYTMVNYFKAIKKTVNCRMCHKVFRSAIGLLGHLECCGAEPVRVACEYCNKDYTKSSLQIHVRTCSMARVKSQTEVEQNKQEAIVPEMYSNTGRLKRASLLKAENKLKAVSKELTAHTTSDSDLKKHIRYERKYKIDAKQRQRWLESLESTSSIKCPHDKCLTKLQSIDAMEEHLTGCSHAPTVGYYCLSCKGSTPVIFSTEMEAIQHIETKHSGKKSRAYDSEDDSDCKLDSNSASDESDDSLSGPATSNDEMHETSVKKKRKSKGKKQKSASSLECIKIFPPQSKDIKKIVRNKWEQFLDENYTKNVLFASAKPDFVEVTTEMISKKVLPVQEISIKFANLSREQLEARGQRVEWCELKRFEIKEDARNRETLIFLGGPCRTLHWIPLPDDVNEQYLLVNCRRDYDKYTRAVNPKIRPALLLLYRLDMTKNGACNQLKLVYAVRVPDGPIHCVDFLPSGGYDATTNRLALLAIGTAKPEVNFYALPITATGIKQQTLCNDIETPVIELKSSFCCALNLVTTPGHGETLTETQCLQLCWSQTAGHRYIFAGYSSGCVAIYNITDDPSENLSLVVVDELNHFVPLSCFYTGHRQMNTLSVHYDTQGPRWLLCSFVSRKVLLYDIRILVNPSLVRDNHVKNIVRCIDWPILWEPYLIGLGDLTAVGSRRTGTCNPFLFGEITTVDYMLASIACLHYNPWQSACAVSSDNGDVSVLIMQDLHFDNAVTEKFMSELDIKSLNGEKLLSQKEIKKDVPNEWHMYEDDYKDRYGLIFGPLLEEEKLTKSRVEPAVMLQRYMRSTCLRWNLNRCAQQFMAIGYDNGFVRILQFGKQINAN